MEFFKAELLKTPGEIITNYANTLLTLMTSLIILGVFFLCKKFFDYNMEEIRKRKALSKIFKGEVKIKNFFKHSYFIEYDEDDEQEEEIIDTPYDNSVFSCEEEEREYKEVYERNNIYSYSNDENTSANYTDYSTDLTDSSDYTRTDYTMTATGEEGETLFPYELESIYIDSEIQIMNILEKIKKNHDNELIKGKV